jgi:ankyrin repeat protein
LLENGADPDTMSQRRFSGSCLQCTTPLADAANHSDSTALQLLLKHRAKIDPEAIFHSIGIPRSRPAGTATMQILIDQGADVNHFSKRWCTPLYHAVHMNQEDHVRLLLDHGAKPSVESIIGKISALDHAKEKGRMNLYEMIEASGSHGSP